jgi:periplasmic protein TonB
MWRRAALLCLLIVVALPCRAETDAVDEWKKQLIIHIRGSMRFPPEAIGQSGTAMVAFVLDRSGKLISNEIKQSSGVKALDTEALAIIGRAQPFPAPPPQVDDNGLKVAVPLIFRGNDTRKEFEKEEARINAKLRSICRGC